MCELYDICAYNLIRIKDIEYILFFNKYINI